MILFGIDHAGFNNRLVCGTVNIFDGWVVNSDRDNPIKTVDFLIEDIPIGSISINMERPDVEKIFHGKQMGFYGCVNIPETSINNTLMVFAIAENGQSHFMQKYPLTEKLSDEEIEFRVNNALPDDMLMHLVVHNVDPKAFLEEGKAGVEMIKSILLENGIDLHSMRNILDFGVGCGRVMRWWKEFSPKINFWGCDINPDLIDWCVKNLDFGNYSVNALQPPTAYESLQFDLVYLFSVFTHLTVETQKNWLSEFARILNPGAPLLVSVHGDNHANNLPKKSLDEYRKNGYCVLTKNNEGKNLCASYQSRRFCEPLFSEYFNILNFYPGHFSSCGNQDLYLLSRKE